jgi:hypothetical protein
MMAVLSAMEVIDFLRLGGGTTVASAGVRER